MIGYQKNQQLGKSKEKKTQTTINIEANEVLDKIYKAKKMFYKCETRIASGCLKKQIRSYGVDLKMTYAHKHKRDWYKEKNRMWLLSTFEQTLRPCIPCHMMLEADPKLTEIMFKKLRSKNIN